MAEVNDGFDSPPEGVASNEVAIKTHDSSHRHDHMRVRGSVVSYHNLNYTVEIAGKCCRKTEKQILFDVR